MGEHTIREILKRRSPETQRAMQRRRELAQGGARRTFGPVLVLIVVLVGVLAYVGYLGWLAHSASQRFTAERGGSPGLTLAGTTEFLPNTLLASLDPAFYNSRGFTASSLTRQLMHVYFPDASALDLRVMAVVVEAQHSKTEIMESFINQVPLSAGPQPVKGLAAAAQYYFGKPFSQLAPQDIALLVALIPDPVGSNPRSHPDQALAARNAVLQDDLQQNVLSEAQVANLTKMPLDVLPQPAGH